MARITLLLPDEIEAQLASRAQALGVSMSEVAADILGEALVRQTPAPLKHPVVDEAARQGDRERLKAALGDLVVEIDPTAFASIFGPSMDAAERAAIIASIPPMDPLLSHAVIEEREERPY